MFLDDEIIKTKSNVGNINFNHSRNKTPIYNRSAIKINLTERSPVSRRNLKLSQSNFGATTTILKTNNKTNLGVTVSQRFKSKWQVN